MCCPRVLRDVRTPAEEKWSAVPEANRGGWIGQTPVGMCPTGRGTSPLILVGEASLRRVLAQFGAPFHSERNLQGKGNVLLFPSADDDGPEDSPIACRERLGGLRKFYYGRAG
jgi:hypothetical protein